MLYYLILAKTHVSIPGEFRLYKYTISTEKQTKKLTIK